jgi:formamidopyrimidine-DNA glycosylase
MPELPEVETIARDLAASIIGAQIESVWGSGFGLHLGRAVDLAGIRRVTTGRRILAVRRKGKFLLLEVAARTDGDRGEHDGAGGARPGIVVHLGMSGRLRVEAASAPRAPHTHVVLVLSDGRELRFVDARRFGWVAPGAPVEARPELAELGPDPLSELNEAELARRLEGGRAPIKAFLLDQRRVAGLGNIYVSEALHRAGIHPTTPAGRVGPRAGALLAGIRAALELGIRNRGTTLRDYVDASGTRGNNAAALRVYGREGEPCPVCGATVRRRIDAGRSTFFCPDCQCPVPARAAAKKASAKPEAATKVKGAAQRKGIARAKTTGNVKATATAKKKPRASASALVGGVAKPATRVRPARASAPARSKPRTWQVAREARRVR